QHRERGGGNGAENPPEQRGVEQGLGQGGARRSRGDHREDVIERETVARVEREQHGVVYGGGLDFEVEALAQPFADGETEAAVEADAEGRMNHDLSAAEAVEETLDYEGA